MQQTYDLDKVKDSALLALLDFLPEEANKERLSPSALVEAYLHKMVRIDDCNLGIEFLIPESKIKKLVIQGSRFRD